MIQESKISSKNQVTLPKAVMQRLGLAPHDHILFQEEGGVIVLKPKNRTLTQLQHTFARRGQPALTPAQMDAAIATGRHPSSSG